MFVITADQVDSRSSVDLVTDLLADLRTRDGDGVDPRRRITLVRPAERTVGDEIQAVADTGRDALRLILHLTRLGRWSVGCGIGTVREPLAATARESSGPAFIAARDAVERAKRRPTRFALTDDPSTDGARSAEALIDLMLALRARRTPEGWELYDLLAEGERQIAVAKRLAITPQAVSNRARNAELRIEGAATGPLEHLLDVADAGHDRGTEERTAIR